MDYNEFLKKKITVVPNTGFEIPKSMMNPKLFDWQRDIVWWALKKGKAALFEDCGAGKTLQFFEWSKQVSRYCGNRPVLVLCPLAVAEQTKREGIKFGYDVNVVREQAQVRAGINVTNYEMLSHFDADIFCGIVLDESSILKSFTGQIRTQIIDTFRNTPYKLSCTATPSPNDYMELGNQAEFLGVMSHTEMLSTYFVHDGGDTSKWRLKGHAADSFWEWVASWAVTLQKPSDLGYDDTGFILPELTVTQHIVKSDINIVGDNYSLFADLAETLTERRDARRNSLKERCELAKSLIDNDPDSQWLFWCDLNAESEYLTDIIDGAVEVRGSDKPDIKAERLNAFTVGEIQKIVSKPSLAGYGLNWQGCHNMVFVGLSDSYEMMYQAIRRCWRYGQKEKVNVYIVISEAEGNVKSNIERKERQASEMMAELVKHTKDILECEIRGTERISIPYNPQIEMEIPEWLKGN